MHLLEPSLRSSHGHRFMPAGLLSLSARFGEEQSYSVTASRNRRRAGLVAAKVLQCMCLMRLRPHGKPRHLNGSVIEFRVAAMYHQRVRSFQTRQSSFGEIPTRRLSILKSGEEEHRAYQAQGKAVTDCLQSGEMVCADGANPNRALSNFPLGAVEGPGERPDRLRCLTDLRRVNSRRTLGQGLGATPCAHPVTDPLHPIAKCPHGRPGRITATTTMHFDVIAVFNR